MSGLACVRCAKFLRAKKNGVAIEEGMPKGDETWGPYKLWMADLYECPGCGFELVTGFGRGPIAEHFWSDYAERRDRYQPIVRVDDCGGAKP